MVYLIVEEYGQYEEYRREELGYVESYEEGEQIIDILNYEIKKQNEVNMYKPSYYSSHNVEYNIREVNKFKLYQTREDIDKIYEEKIKAAKEEYKKENEEKNQQKILAKELRTNELKSIIYNILDTNGEYKNILKEIKEYIYLSSDPKVVKWLHENSIKL